MPTALPSLRQSRLDLFLTLNSTCRNQLLRQAEVHHLGVAPSRQHYVGGLQIAVDDSFAVGFFHCFRDFDHYGQHLFLRQEALVEPFLECLTLHALHDDEVFALAFSDFVDVADVGMIQCSSRPGFANEPFAGDGVLLQRRAKEFQGDLSAERCVLGQEYLTHASLADLLQDPEVSNRAACQVDGRRIRLVFGECIGGNIEALLFDLRL